MQKKSFGFLEKSQKIFEDEIKPWEEEANMINFWFILKDIHQEQIADFQCSGMSSEILSSYSFTLVPYAYYYVLEFSFS